MARSRKKAILKDRPRNIKKTTMYWRAIRSTIKTAIRSCKDLEELELPDPKTIVNDYNRCDYIIDYEYIPDDGNWWTNYKQMSDENREKYRRK
jgi:hypothetical protein